MDTKPYAAIDESSVLTVRAPSRQSVPVVFSSPHSGRDYPEAFVAASRLDAKTLRRSEDSFVDELYACVPELGAPLISARFPRAYCDPNREPYELDPVMFSGPLPRHANTRSPRVVAGLGTIARVVASGAEIYAGKLSVAEAEARIAQYYRPYHDRLGALVGETREKFGWSLLVDCHSMPSVGGPMDRDSGLSRVDVVLGDCFGASCDSIFTETAEAAFEELGYRVVRNTPYAGGFTTRHYGDPGHGSHALQIELNRALYMVESEHAHGPRFAQVQGDLRRVAAALCAAAAGFGAPAGFGVP
ncbi:N-formylglutamate amidohydrolase [Paramagnetospirillum kuznetsovii]|uniref:N-formylglutamate amidohydrolase n=1 Tax=Paramagnetospirillum kuznetsovii TaxID=2053833 RepID=A0A364NZG2_9PROT|nr:N-formylglutamate amidohydrolase [Paramagnetospirillum kuznetsovii]RAU22464.1 N-formylglutamate amidohydrolase [Paramagnetospirillum kuznetsovii]